MSNTSRKWLCLYSKSRTLKYAISFSKPNTLSLTDSFIIFQSNMESHFQLLIPKEMAIKDKGLKSELLSQIPVNSQSSSVVDRIHSVSLSLHMSFPCPIFIRLSFKYSSILSVHFTHGLPQSTLHFSFVYSTNHTILFHSLHVTNYSFHFLFSCWLRSRIVCTRLHSLTYHSMLNHMHLSII